MKNKKEDIIDYATNLFMEQGYFATSTRQIAKGLNITQPAIYHHFKNKEDIYVAVLRKFTQQVGRELNAILNSNLNPEETLITISELLIDNHSMNFSLIMKDMDKELSKEVRHQIYLLWNANYLQPFHQFFDSIQNEMVPSVNPKNVPFHFLRILSAYADKNINQSSDVSIREVIHIFFYGLLKQ